MTIPGRHILARVTLKPTPDGSFECVLPLWGFAYHLELRPNGGSFELTAYDGPAVGAYRLPRVDDA